MLHVGYQGSWAIVGVQVILLNAVIATDGEESCGGTIIADGSNVVDCLDVLIGHSFCANVPCTSLAIGSYVSKSSLYMTDQSEIDDKEVTGYVPFGVLDYASVLGPGEPTRPWLPLLFLIEHANDTGCIAAMGSFGDTPYS